ncbi:MAG: response regulator [Thermoanaerobaculia bacterium]|nr:response regulator [Thermoanaerobaculia bacterium]
MHLLSIHLLGSFSATDHLGNALSIGKRVHSLIIYLALRAGKGGSVSEAASMIFGDPNATSLVAESVAHLRVAARYLPNEIVIVQNDAISFNPAVVAIDAREFEACAGTLSINGVREAAEIYAGNLLDGYSSGSAGLDDLIIESRLHHWQLAVGVLGRLLAVQIQAGWWESAVDTASRLLALDPSQEVVHRTLMRLQLEQGRADSSLRRYQECSDILRRDFGRAPSAETERLHDEILRALNHAPAPRELFRNPIDGPVLILLVEDDMVTSALVEGYLTEAGYGVVAAADGADALIEIGRRRFDLLILDINLPTLSGLRLFEIMIRKGFETPAMFITGSAGAETEARSLEMGAADFLRKPIRKEALLPRIRAILKRTKHDASRQANGV